MSYLSVVINKRGVLIEQGYTDVSVRAVLDGLWSMRVDDSAQHVQLLPATGLWPEGYMSRDPDALSGESTSLCSSIQGVEPVARSRTEWTLQDFSWSLYQVCWLQIQLGNEE